MHSLLRVALLMTVIFTLSDVQSAAASSKWECIMDCAMRSSQALFACAEQPSEERCNACVEHRIPLCERCLTERCGLEDAEEVRNSCAAHRSGGAEVCPGKF